MTKDEFKSAVVTAFEEKGYRKIRLSMALFGLQCRVTYQQEGIFFKQEAHVWFRERDGRQFLKVEQENGMEWDWTIPAR